MELILLTKSSVPVIGQVAYILGMIMDALFKFTSQFGITNIGLSIILFTIIINLLMWPLTVSQQRSSKLMSVMQPEIQAIQKKYKNKTDQASVMRMQSETKAVYAKYGTSMSGSCLFLLIQMPILFALYQVIYKIPAYVPSVYNVFQTIADPLMRQNGYISVLNEIGTKIKPALGDEASLNMVIDFLYKFTPEQWTMLEGKFPALAATIATGAAEIGKMNYFLGVNLSTAPFQGFMPNPAWIIPFVSAAVQWYSAKLMTDATRNRKSSRADEENVMAQQMQSMNTMMPLMSLFFCFTLPAGIGIYWVASGLCRMIQQLIINSQLNKMDIDEIVKKNLEKANAKALKEGKSPSQIKSNTDKVLRNVKKQEQEAENEEEALQKKIDRAAKQAADSSAYYNKNARPGSLASKANMVALFDERQMEKKKNKGKQESQDE
ncbi:YidC/Oxa1 family membrane protein insertase [Moryella indoligenes]|uniref:YidC/Oxa1 family membrane protein insertase n=1 Tax=Moryella indoligenes TaxID=371674 RepID=A0AAE3V9P6_9FIRM|nr:YidC/Oxa1 family membrane protein insertase [Moryella indoligenes]MDQ0152269.1 YidC/Oxa1 family membrane protein insertase [Moryella indoligenes]